MKKKRRVLLILAISLILIAVIFAIAIEKALNSVLSPEMVKQLLEDEDLKGEIGKVVANGTISDDVKKFVYENASDNKNDIKVSRNDKSDSNNRKDKKNISGQKTNLQIEESNKTFNDSDEKTNIKADSSANSSEKNTPSSSNKSSTKMSPSDQLEAIRIVLSVMTTSEIKDLIDLYKSGKKQEAIQKGKQILKERLSPQQKNRLKELYRKYM